MRIQHNIMAMNSYRNLSGNNNALSKNLEKLSSGYRINRAGDDAAGLAISEKMRAQISGLDQAQKNAQSGINLVKTAEGALTEVHDMLNRMVTLATQSANGTYTGTDRAKLQAEVDALTSEINRIAENSNFNGAKLLDGSLEVGNLTEQEVKFNTTSSTAGVTINEATNGGGTKGSVTIDFTNAFTQGDTIKLDLIAEDGTPTDATFTMQNALTSTQTDFTGKTVEEQVKSLAAKMGVHATIGTNFDITVDGTSITLTAKEEGVGAAFTVDNITVTDKDVAASVTAAVSDGAAEPTGGSPTAAKSLLQLIGGSAAGDASSIKAGDKLTFTFLDADGEELTVDLDITEQMESTDAQRVTEEIVKALKDKNFNDNEDTVGIDESQLKVSDLFTLEAGTGAGGNGIAMGSIQVTTSATNLTATSNGTAKDVVIERGGQKTTVDAVVTAGTVASTGAKAQVYKATFDDADQNFSVGDKITFEGSLRDGSTFKVELTAGEDFEIDTNTTAATALQNTLKNIETALVSKDVAVEVTAKDGSKKTLAGADLFGTGTTSEFKVAAGADTIVITSNKAGTAATYNGNEMTGITVTPMDDADAVLTKNLAKPQTAAESSFVIDDKIGYGAAVKVGDKTYEIVADSRDTTNRNNTAIVVSDLTDSKAIAKQLADAIQADNKDDYTVTTTDNKVSIATKKVGSDQVALEISAPYGDEVSTASFKFDAAEVEEGSTLEFNGNKYEFVKAGSKASNGAIAIEVADFAKATAKDLATAFADVAKNGLVTVGDDGTVTLKSLEGEDGTIAKPEISFGKDLTLQIGADAVETIGVSVASMKAKDLGIEGLNIGDVENANKAIDTVKAAIESVSVVRGNLGAIQNRLEHTINNLGVMEENIQDAEANIRDTDIADEMMAYTKNNILIQSAQAMLAQANQVPQGVLQLMG